MASLPCTFRSFPLESAKVIVDCIPADRRMVLLGESTHGTEEFYRTRAEVTKRLIEERGFTGEGLPSWTRSPDRASLHEGCGLLSAP